MFFSVQMLIKHLAQHCRNAGLQLSYQAGHTTSLHSAPRLLPLPSLVLPLRRLLPHVQVVVPAHPQLASLLMSRYVAVEVLEEQLEFLNSIESAGEQQQGNGA